MLVWTQVRDEQRRADENRYPFKKYYTETHIIDYVVVTKSYEAIQNSRAVYEIKGYYLKDSTRLEKSWTFDHSYWKKQKTKWVSESNITALHEAFCKIEAAQVAFKELLENNLEEKNKWDHYMMTD